jgi:hypothetical protein
MKSIPIFAALDLIPNLFKRAGKGTGRVLDLDLVRKLGVGVDSSGPYLTNL